MLYCIILWSLSKTVTFASPLVAAEAHDAITQNTCREAAFHSDNIYAVPVPLFYGKVKKDGSFFMHLRIRGRDSFVACMTVSITDDDEKRGSIIHVKAGLHIAVKIMMCLFFGIFLFPAVYGIIREPLNPASYAYIVPCLICNPFSWFIYLWHFLAFPLMKSKPKKNCENCCRHPLY